MSRVSSKQFVEVKYCKFLPLKRCYHSNCDFLNSFGEVMVCKFHANPKDRFSRRVLKEVR